MGRMWSASRGTERYIASPTALPVVLYTATAAELKVLVLAAGATDMFPACASVIWEMRDSAEAHFDDAVQLGDSWLSSLGRSPGRMQGSGS